MADLHLGNVLLQAPLDFNQLSREELYNKYDAPSKEAVIRNDGKPLPQGMPPYLLIPGQFGKRSDRINLPEAKIWLNDFGTSFSPSIEKKYHSQTPLGGFPPEVKFEPDSPLSYPSDIWTLAYTLWATFGQLYLFRSAWATVDDMVCEHVDALGRLPLKWWDKWENRNEWFDEKGDPIPNRDILSLDERFEKFIQEPRRKDGLQEYDKDERAAITSMFRSMLVYNPEDRISAEDLVKCDWMNKWGLPTYKKMLLLRDET